MVSLCVLYRHDVLHVFHDTYSGMVALLVGTDGTDIRVAYVMADTAIFYVMSQLAYGVGE